jgi:hypothetical protein
VERRGWVISIEDVVQFTIQRPEPLVSATYVDEVAEMTFQRGWNGAAPHGVSIVTK